MGHKNAEYAGVLKLKCFQFTMATKSLLTFRCEQKSPAFLVGSIYNFYIYILCVDFFAIARTRKLLLEFSVSTIVSLFWVSPFDSRRSKPPCHYLSLVTRVALTQLKSDKIYSPPQSAGPTYKTGIPSSARTHYCRFSEHHRNHFICS
jgi:hypothetical protein